MAHFRLSPINLKLRSFCCSYIRIYGTSVLAVISNTAIQYIAIFDFLGDDIEYLFSPCCIFDITCCCLIVTSNIRYFSAVEKIEFRKFIAKFDYLCTLNLNLGVLFSNLATNRYGAKISNIDEPPDTKNP